MIDAVWVWIDDVPGSGMVLPRLVQAARGLE